MFCARPFTYLMLHKETVSCCCSNFFNSGLQTPWESKGMSPWQMWNCREFHLLRQSILDGSFRYCQLCPEYLSGNLLSAKKDHYKVDMDTAPEHLNIACDRTCNLACPSCRRNLEIDPDVERLNALLGGVWHEFKHNIKSIWISSQGDPFFSPCYRNFLQSIPDDSNLEIEMSTNGLLLPTYWDSMPRSRFRKIFVSIDAATAETYAFLRRPAKWANLIKALNFLQINKHIKTQVIFTFVVSKVNYKEIPAFATFARSYGAETWYLPLVLWTPDFAQLKLGEQEWQELMEILKDPRLQGVNTDRIRSVAENVCNKKPDWTLSTPYKGKIFI